MVWDAGTCEVHEYKFDSENLYDKMECLKFYVEGVCEWAGGGGDKCRALENGQKYLEVKRIYSRCVQRPSYAFRELAKFNERYRRALAEIVNNSNYKPAQKLTRTTDGGDNVYAGGDKKRKG